MATGDDGGKQGYVLLKNERAKECYTSQTFRHKIQYEGLQGWYIACYLVALGMLILDNRVCAPTVQINLLGNASNKNERKLKTLSVKGIYNLPLGTVSLQLLLYVKRTSVLKLAASSNEDYI